MSAIEELVFGLLKKEIHQNSVNHGFWEDPALETKFALMHAELGEAMGEYQHGRPMVWYACTECDSYDICNPPDEYECLNYGHEAECKYRSKKPEGIAVELIDCVIRILDFMEYAGMTVKEITVEKAREELSLSQLVNWMHIRIAYGWNYYLYADFEKASAEELSFVVNTICFWIDSRGNDSGKLLAEKHEYNKTRPYMHGKTC